MPPAFPALLMGQQSSQSISRVFGQPLIHCIGITWLEPPSTCDGIRCLAGCNLQQGGAAFAHVGMRVMVTGGQQFLALGLRYVSCSSGGHRLILSDQSFSLQCLITGFESQKSLGIGMRAPKRLCCLNACAILDVFGVGALVGRAESPLACSP